jgi:ribose transport system substrate-binding protein
MTTGLAAVAVLALAGAACSSDDTATDGGSDSTAASGESTAAESKEATGETSPEVLEMAAEITAMAEEGVVYTPNDVGDPFEETVSITGDWQGPTDQLEPPEDVSVQIVICGPGTACEVGAEYNLEAAEELGWDAEIVASDGTPAGHVQAMETAISRDPDVIMTWAIPAAAVGPQLEQAEQDGIITVSIADSPIAGGQTSGTYDAAVSNRNPFAHQILAWAIINDSEGTANAAVMNDSGFPVLVDSTAEFTRVFDECAGCSQVTQDIQITDALDPVKIGSIVSSVLDSNPDLDYIVMPYSIGIAAVLEAVRSAGMEDTVKVVTKDGDELGLQTVAEGDSPFNAAASLRWASWAATDQAIRGLTGVDYLTADQVGLGVHLYRQDDVPEDNIANLDQWVDFPAEYRKIWGLGS